MCVYHGDHAEYFDEALASVYNQSRLPDEVVLTVDGPVSAEIDSVITKYQKNEGMKVVRLEKNMGHGIARRTGLSNCTNEIVAIADADDINDPTRFEQQLMLFGKNSKLSAVSSSCYHFIGEISNITYIDKMPVTHEEICAKMKTMCPLTQASAMFKKSEVERVGGYMDWYHAEDYYLWIRMMENGAEFANVSAPLLYVRSAEDYMARRGGWNYFKSLEKLFRYMLKHKIINLPTYLYNVSTRFVAQILLPGSLRAKLRKLIS